jgi:nucleotide-binding universal stress UspA family protein
MFRSILVPLDGSPCGEYALPLARTVARRTGAAVRVVHVHTPQDSRHPDWHLPPEQRSDPEALKAQEKYLDGIVSKLTAAGVAASAEPARRCCSPRPSSCPSACGCRLPRSARCWG